MEVVFEVLDEPTKRDFDPVCQFFIGLEAFEARQISRVGRIPIVIIEFDQ